MTPNSDDLSEPRELGGDEVEAVSGGWPSMEGPGWGGVAIVVVVVIVMVMI